MRRAKCQGVVAGCNYVHDPTDTHCEEIYSTCKRNIPPFVPHFIIVLSLKKRTDDQYYCRYSGFSVLSYVREPLDVQYIYIPSVQYGESRIPSNNIDRLKLS